MKKTIILLLIIGVFYVFVSDALAKKLTIPDDAIRIRIIPNSNSAFDQDIKAKVKDKIEITMYDLLKDAESSEEAEEIIKNNLELVDRDVKKVLSDEIMIRAIRLILVKIIFQKRSIRVLNMKKDIMNLYLLL